MKSAIVLCLLATLCGLAIADSKYEMVNKSEHKFDIIEALFHMQHKVTNIMILNVEELMHLEVFLILARASSYSAFQAKITSELNNTRVVVDAAIAQGKDAEYCFKDAENKYGKIPKIVEPQLDLCTNTTFKNFKNSFGISSEILKEGNGVIKEISMTYAACHGHLFHINRCLAEWMERCRIHVECFDKKYKWYPIYRKMLTKELVQSTILCLHRAVVEVEKKLTEEVFFTNSCIEGAE